MIRVLVKLQASDFVYETYSGCRVDDNPVFFFFGKENIDICYTLQDANKDIWCVEKPS